MINIKSVYVVIFAGGYGYGYTTVLEYDITGDSIRKIGKMREAHAWHAISVVKSAEFSQWWWCP